MTATDTIRILQSRAAAGQHPLSPEEWKRVAARVAWVRETMAALHEAMRQRDDRCTAAVEHLDEEGFNRLFEVEQAKVNAIRAQIDAVIERDEWPRALYFGGI